jgi:hypothetical protein
MISAFPVTPAFASSNVDYGVLTQRLRRERKKPNGEMGVLVFAWTKASKNPGLTKIIRKKKRSTRKQAVFNPKVS